MANFQSTIPNQLGQAAVSTALATLYTVPATTRTYLKDIDVANNTGFPASITVWLVAAGGAAGTGNAVALLPNVPVPVNGVVQWTGSQVLLPGMSIQFQGAGVGAQASGLGIVASGGEAT